MVFTQVNGDADTNTKKLSTLWARGNGKTFRGGNVESISLNGSSSLVYYKLHKQKNYLACARCAIQRYAARARLYIGSKKPETPRVVCAGSRDRTLKCWLNVRHTQHAANCILILYFDAAAAAAPQTTHTLIQL